MPNPPQKASQPCSTEHGVASQRPLTESAGTMVMELATSAAAPAESTALTENEKGPAALGVPEEIELPDTARGGGSAPALIDHAYGGVPPEAVKEMAG